MTPSPQSLVAAGAADPCCATAGGLSLFDWSIPVRKEDGLPRFGKPHLTISRPTCTRAQVAVPLPVSGEALSLMAR